MPKTAKLIYAADSADIRHATGLEASDPFVWCEGVDGKTHILTSSLEIDHATRDATVDHVHDYRTIAEGAKNAGVEKITISTLIAHHLKGAEEVQVPAEFPLHLAQALQAEGMKITPMPAPFFNARTQKTPEEVEKLRVAQRTNEQGMKKAIDILQNAEIARNKDLLWQNKPLTSEILQAEMNAEIVRHGGIGFNAGSPIAAGGVQGADPHERGHGVLKAGEFIVIDTFPRHKNGFNGDMTRTFFKGEMSGWHQDMFNAVKEAQALCLSMIKEGVNGADIQKAAENFFLKQGYKTGVDSQGRYYGFFHGIGHGVGLEVHDFPQGTLSSRACTLKAGMVTSVEPGLYYPKGHYGEGEYGGVRIEDVVAVTKGGYDSMNTLPAEIKV